MKQNNIPKKGVKRGEKGSNQAISFAGVQAIASFLPILRRYERAYGFRDVSVYLSILMAYNGSMGVTRLCMEYYGYKCRSSYRYTQYALVRLRDAGLAESVGGKWSLTEKGMRELGLID